MTIPSERRGDGRGSPPWHGFPRDRALTGRQARRLSRNFAGVGVAIPPPRLRELAEGAKASDAESTDVAFAFVATEIQREERLARHRRTRRNYVRWLIAAGLLVVLLNTLVCIGYVFFALTQHGWGL